MSDPFARVDDAPAATLRAAVLPLRRSQEAFDAELLGRVGNDRVRIRKDDGSVFAVDRFRLHAVEKEVGVPRRRLSNAELNVLPWRGAGPDPLTHHEADKPWRRVRPGSSRGR